MNIRYANYNGKEMTLNEIAKATGISYQTIKSRYDVQGLRGEELITGGQRKGSQLSYEGSMITLSDDERDNLKKRNLPLKRIQQRLDDGWDYDLALNLNRFYVSIDNQPCYQFKVRKHLYAIPYDELIELEMDEITRRHIVNGLTAGNDIYDIVPTGTVVYINGVKHTGEPDVFDEMEDEYIEKKVQAYKASRYREKKPHLFQVPQQHTESKYAKYLWESYTFKCKEVVR
jgi:hypothetical protein